MHIREFEQNDDGTIPSTLLHELERDFWKLTIGSSQHHDSTTLGRAARQAPPERVPGVLLGNGDFLVTWRHPHGKNKCRTSCLRHQCRKSWSQMKGIAPCPVVWKAHRHSNWSIVSHALARGSKGRTEEAATFAMKQIYSLHLRQTKEKTLSSASE